MMTQEQVLCPWCGSEMVLMELIGSYHYECGECGASSPWRDTASTARAAAMKRYEPPIKPMTLDELDKIRAMNNGHWPYATPPYLRIETNKEYLDWISWTELQRYLRLASSWYGITWRCWSRKPTDDERAAAKWEDDKNG